MRHHAETGSAVRQGGKQHLLGIEFDSQFYQFLDDKSVALKAASSEFDQPEVQANGKKFKLHDKNSLAGENKYPYWIKVQRWIMFQGWTDCPPLDPVIINGH